MFKPPKMFHLKVNSETVPPPPAQPVPEPENQRVWSPSVTSEAPQSETLAVQPATPSLPPIQDDVLAKEEKQVEPETISQQNGVPDLEVASDDIEAEVQSSEAVERVVQSEEDFSRYARPKATDDSAVIPETDSMNNDLRYGEKLVESNDDASVGVDIEEETENIKSPVFTESDPQINSSAKILEEHKKVVRAPSLNSIPFADIWYTAEKIAYIRDKETPFALIPFETDDMEDFYKTLEQGYTGQSSYAIRFAGESYRVERIITLAGVQYNCRKMPGEVPDIYSLGLPKHTVDYLLTLGKESGLLLFGGPTGMGKTTSASALMKKFLEIEGGFMYTIEDPPEMPLEGLYRAQNGGLGLCKQCPVDNERWGDGIKSALRSRPRYILVGEIRTPETASQVLRAATSGHLVLSTIHASTVEDALESLIKYASGAGLTESLAADLLARGILGVIHQKLEGSSVLRPVLTSVFANPHLTGGDQMRSLIRNNTINLQTLIEAQSSRMMQGRPLFGSDKLD